jgi:hypothetical protein
MSFTPSRYLAAAFGLAAFAVAGAAPAFAGSTAHHGGLSAYATVPSGGYNFDGTYNGAGYDGSIRTQR